MNGGDDARPAPVLDRATAASVELAFTLLITRGLLEPRDRALLRSTAPDAPIAAIAHATSIAFLNVLLANEVASGEPYVAIDLEVGDYRLLADETARFGMPLKGAHTTMEP